MLVIIVLLAMISAYLIASGINRTSSEVSVERDLRTREALLQAKAALIAYAAAQAWTNKAGNPFPDKTDQPGSLPCPDNDNNGGADAVPDCTSGASRVGRFPWKTVGAPELRDASGETLWYAVSASFRTRSNTTRVNSDTQGALTVVGTAPETNVVALLIAPGAPVQDPLLSGQSQDRSSANVNRVASYLEDKNAGGTDVYTTAAPGANGVYDAGATTYNSMAQSVSFFNDRMVSITAAELMSVVEPVVAARIERYIKPYLTAYFQEWGAFPFPAKFDDPDPGSNSDVSPPVTTRTQAQYIGDATQTAGLLPVTASASYSYVSSSASVTLTSGLADSLSGLSCTSVTDGIRCDFTVNSLDNWFLCGSWTNRHCIVNPSFRLVADVANVGLSIATLNDADVTVTNSSGTARTMTSVTLTRALSSTGTATITYQGTWSYSNNWDSPKTRSMRVTFPVKAGKLTDEDDADAGFFIRNEWYRQLYYAVSPGYLPGAGASCTVRPALPGVPAADSCLMVNDLPSRYSANDDKRAILILMGRSLNGSARPSSSLGNYLEGTNATALSSPLYVFQHREIPSASINDKVIVVCPDASACP